MSLEKETNGQEPETPKKEDKPTRSKPVVIYIMILFIAAFLLMALSFLMHQRSNTEALGNLQNSVTAMQEVQANQEKIIELQDQLSKAEDALEAQEKTAEEALAAKQQELDEQAKIMEAMTDLYRLQQAYSNQNYELCQKIIDSMESGGTAEYLPTVVSSNVPLPPPNVRFQQIKEAVTAILALGD